MSEFLDFFFELIARFLGSTKGKNFRKEFESCEDIDSDERIMIVDRVKSHIETNALCVNQKYSHFLLIKKHGNLKVVVLDDNYISIVTIYLIDNLNSTWKKCRIDL